MSPPIPARLLPPHGCDDCAEHASLKDGYAQLLAERVKERAIAERMAQAFCKYRRALGVYTADWLETEEAVDRVLAEWEELKP